MTTPARVPPSRARQPLERLLCEGLVGEHRVPAHAEPWADTEEQREQLLYVLRAWSAVGWRVRTPDSSPARVDPGLSATSVPWGKVGLSGADARRIRVPIEQFLAANPGLARAAGFAPDWPSPAYGRLVERAIAGDRVTLPETDQRPGPGWIVDWASPHPDDRVRLLHAAVAAVVAVDADKLLRRAEASPAERLRQAQFQLDGQTVRVEGVALVVDRLLFSGGIERSLSQMLNKSPELAPLLASVFSEELEALQLGLRQHDTQGDVFHLPESFRAALPEYAPLLRWQLKGFEGLFALLEHPALPEPLRVAASLLPAWLDQRTDPDHILRADPVVHPRHGMARVTDWNPHRVQLDVQGRAESLAISVFLNSNPWAVEPLLRAAPDLVLESTDPGLAGAFAAIWPGPNECLEPYAQAIQVEIPDASSDAACMVLRDVLRMGNLPTLWRDPTGRWRQLVDVRDGRFRFDAMGPLSSARALGSRETDRGVVDGQFQPVWLTAGQLTFASPDLAAALALGQAEDPWLDDARRGRSWDDWMEISMRTLEHELGERLETTQRHDDGSINWMRDYSKRLQANLDDLRRRKWFRAALAKHDADHLGAALRIGDFSTAGRRAGEDRIRITEELESVFLGPLLVICMGGGDAGTSAPSGPRLSQLLEDLQYHVHRGLHDAVDMNDVAQGLQDALVNVSKGGEDPFASVLVAAIHRSSGEVALANCGTGMAWRLGADRMERVIWSQSVEGLGHLASRAGLDNERAIQFALFAHLRRTQKNALALVEDRELFKASEEIHARGPEHIPLAAVGGRVDRLEGAQQSLRELLDTLGGQVHVLDQAKAMVSKSRLRLLPGERLVLGTDGLVGPLRDEPRVFSALQHPSPLRAAHFAASAVSAREGADDVAIVVYEATPTDVFFSPHVRHGQKYYRRVSEQDALYTEAVVPGGDGEFEYVATHTKKLGAIRSEVERLLQRRELPPRSAGWKHVAGLWKWTQQRQQKSSDARRESPDAVQHLHEIFETPNDDSLDDVLVIHALLKRAKIPAKLVRGIRIRRAGGVDSYRDCAWLVVHHDGEDWVVDPGIDWETRIRWSDALRAFATEGRRRAFRARPEVAYYPFAETWIHKPVAAPMALPEKRAPRSGDVVATTLGNKPSSAPVVPVENDGFLDLS